MTHDTAASLQLLLTPGKPAIAAGTRNRIDVLVRLQAAATTQAPRTPLSLAVVLDRSGSMAGQPLAEAKRCARMIVDGLGPRDRAAIFAFDDEVQCFAPLIDASHKTLLAAAIDSIASGGSTDLHAGWHAGADALRAGLVADGLHRVILLSDGNANAGTVDLETIAVAGKALAHASVTTSTYGLGDAFNENLMLALATAGRGNAYYGRTAADLAEPFEAELALLSNLCARGVMLKVTVAEGVSVRMLNAYAPVDGESHAWWLPDVAFASEAWAMLELTVEPERIAAAGDLFTLPVSVSVQAKAPEASPLYLIAGVPSLPVVDPAALSAMPRDALVDTRLLELRAAQALERIRVAVAASDWTEARKLLDDAQATYAAHPWAAAILATMRRLVDEGDAAVMAKEVAYATRSLNVRLASVAEDAGSFDDLEVPLFLRRKGSQGTGRRQ